MRLWGRSRWAAWSCHDCGCTEWLEEHIDALGSGGRGLGTVSLAESVDAQTEDEAGGIVSESSFKRLSEQERTSIFEALGGSSLDNAATYASLVENQNANQKLYDIRLTLQSCSARLIDDARKVRLDVAASFGNASVLLSATPIVQTVISCRPCDGISVL